MDDFTEGQEILNQYGVEKEDFETGRCEICKQEEPVTTVLLSFHVIVPFEELSAKDQKFLTTHPEAKPSDGMKIPLDQVLAGDFCASCLAKSLMADSLRINVVSPKGHISTPVKSFRPDADDG